MATKLKNMRLTSVDLVRNGANQEADICLFKSTDPKEAPTQPTTEEKNIFKRFINWLRENHADEPQDDEDTVEKADEQPEDIVDIYKSAITESLQSIISDETLTAAEKNDMIAKSMEEYHDAMLNLLSVSKADEDDEEEWEWDDEEEEVEKINHNHDSLGRFASGGGGGGSAGFTPMSKEEAREWLGGMKNDAVIAITSPRNGTTLYRKDGDGDARSVIWSAWTDGEWRPGIGSVEGTKSTFRFNISQGRLMDSLSSNRSGITAVEVRQYRKTGELLKSSDFDEIEEI